MMASVSKKKQGICEPVFPLRVHNLHRPLVSTTWAVTNSRSKSSPKPPWQGWPARPSTIGMNFIPSGEESPFSQSNAFNACRLPLKSACWPKCRRFHSHKKARRTQELESSFPFVLFAW